MRRVRLVVAAILVSLLTFPTAAAHADTVSYTTVKHYSDTLTAVGNNGTATVQLPVPEGLIPLHFQATLHSDKSVTGQVTVTAGDASVVMPADKGGNVSLDLTGSLIDGFIPVTLRNIYTPDELICTANNITPQLLDSISVSFTGVAKAPQTVADFFSPSATGINIVVPQDYEGDKDLANAAMQMTASLGRMYPAGVPVTVTSEPVYGGMLTRTVVFKPTTASPSKTSVSVERGTPVLIIAGKSTDLTSASVAVAAEALPLASEAAVTGLSAETRYSPQQEMTVAELGQKTISLQGIGSVSASIGVDQVRFTPPVSAYTVHVQGANTPSPMGTQSRVSLLWNETLLASKELKADDAWSLDAVVDSPGRAGQLIIRMEAAHTEGNCGGPGLPIRADVDTTLSTVTATAGQGLPPGFARFPQIFGDVVPVAFGTGEVTLSEVDSAAQLMLSLSRVNPLPMMVDVVDLSDVEGKRISAIVVGATTEDSNMLKAPLRMNPTRTVDSTGEHFEVTVNAPFAALEGYEQENRNLLILAHTAGGESLANGLAHAVTALPFGWASMESDLFVSTGDKRKPFFLNSDSLVPQTQVTNEFKGLPMWLLPLSIILLIALALRVLYVRKRNAQLKRYAEAFKEDTANRQDSGRHSGSPSEREATGESPVEE